MNDLLPALKVLSLGCAISLAVVLLLLAVITFKEFAQAQSKKRAAKRSKP